MASYHLNFTQGEVFLGVERYAYIERRLTCYIVQVLRRLF